MPDDLKPPQQAQAEAASFAYGISRYEQVPEKNNRPRCWIVFFRRQGREIRRSFPDQTYGGREMARIMATAWRDAAMRLIPPVTKRQIQTHLRSTNTSGVSGVSPKRVQGRLVAWRVSLRTPERSYFKTFSLKTYGQNAKKLAIAERQRLLDRYGTDSFISLNETSRRDFAHLLEHPQPGPDPAEISRRIGALDQWFDQLRPEQLSVSLKVYHSPVKASATASLSITSLGQRYSVVRKGLQLTWRSYPQRLPELWQFMQATVTAKHGGQRWQDFAARHESAFMASTAQEGFRVRHYSAPFSYPACLTPPASLLPMLAGFEVPALPYWTAQASAVRNANTEGGAGAAVPMCAITSTA